MTRGDLFSLETNCRNLECEIRIVVFPPTSPISQLDRPYPHIRPRHRASLPHVVSDPPNGLIAWMSRSDTRGHQNTHVIRKTQPNGIHSLQVRPRHAQPVHRPVKR